MRFFKISEKLDVRFCLVFLSLFVNAQDSDVSKTTQENTYESIYRLVETKETCGDRFHHGCMFHFDTCLAIEEYLKTQRNKPPMICDRGFEERLGFKPVVWEPVPNDEIDWDVLRRYMEQVYFQADPHSSVMDQQWELEKQEYMQWIASGKTVLSRAKFNLDNVGGDELVYRVMNKVRECVSDEHTIDTIHAPKASHFVLDELGNIDTKFMRALLASSPAEFFTYQGRTYGSHWDQGGGYGTDGGHFHIRNLFNPTGDGLGISTMCSFRYFNGKGEAK